MLALQHDKDGKIVAYAEYTIVNSKAIPDKNGDYAFVYDTWCHNSVQCKGVLRDFVLQEHGKFPQVNWIYYYRSKHNNRLKTFNIRRFYKNKEKENGK